jgi:hypothetical protein
MTLLQQKMDSGWALGWDDASEFKGMRVREKREWQLHAIFGLTL